MKPFEWKPEAADEYREALAASAAESPRIAAEFHQTVEELIRDITTGLFVAAPHHGSSCRKHPLLRFPYSLVYLDDPDMIRIVAFAHHKRRSGYWKSRLRP